MRRIEIQAKTILRRRRRPDSWFVSACGMNLYRGCEHNCVYCDGRSEKYMVGEEFGTTVSVKTNAVDLLSRELDPARRRKPFPGGFILIGGGVGDAYQPMERKYRLSRSVLELIRDFQHPVHILTKSTLVLRDLDLIREIHERRRAVVSMSFSCYDKKAASVVEPGVAPPEERLQALTMIREEGIPAGMYLMPVIPYVSDGIESLKMILSRAKQAGIDFMIFGGLTLKEGRQKDYYLDFISERFPELREPSRRLYGNSDPWGQAGGNYYDMIHGRFLEAIRPLNIPCRLPFSIFRDITNIEERVLVMLEQIDYMLKLYGVRSSFGFAAHTLACRKESIGDLVNSKDSIRGISSDVRGQVCEIIQTGTSRLYHQLLSYRKPE